MMTPDKCLEVLRSLADDERFYAHHMNVYVRQDTPEAMAAALSRELGATIVCLCGSTRFKEAFDRANLEETLAGRIVLSVGCTTHSDAELGDRITPEVKARLDELHKRKIDLADEILVLNVGGYVGESTRSEIEHARRTGKPIRWLVQPEATT